MLQCKCGKYVKDAEFLGVDKTTGKLIFRCSCGEVIKCFMGC